MAIQKESPLSVAILAEETDQRAEEAAKLPGRLERYSIAQHHKHKTCDYLSTMPRYSKIEKEVRECGSYLVFNHYYTLGKVRLAQMFSCKKHLLCPFCAIRRGAKQVKAYLDRFQVIQEQDPFLKPYLITLTVKNGDDLAERYEHLVKAMKDYNQQRRNAIKGTRAFVQLNYVAGAVWSYEFTNKGNGWHPHLHMIALCEGPIDQEKLSEEWRELTGDSFIVDARPFREDQEPAEAFLEVFKYALKFSDLPTDLNVEAYEILKGRRLVASFGVFRGVEVPEELTDEGLDDDELPYYEMFYRFVRGSGYNFVKQNHFTPVKYRPFSLGTLHRLQAKYSGILLTLTCQYLNP